MTERERRQGQRGQTTPLILAFAAIIVLVLAVVIDASAAFLERQRLDAVADGASLAGADAAAEGLEVYAGGLDQTLRLSEPEAERAVREHLRRTGAYDDHPGLRATVRISGDRLVVELSAPVELPLHMPGVPVRTVVGSHGSAIVQADPP